MQLVSQEPPSAAFQTEQALLPCLPAPSRPTALTPCTLLDPLPAPSQPTALPCALDPLPALNQPPMALPFTLDPLMVQRLPEVLYLVGTAHVSKKSADLAYHVVRAARPDAVMVELCWDRSQVRSEGKGGGEGGERWPAPMRWSRSCIGNAPMCEVRLERKWEVGSTVSQGGRGSVAGRGAALHYMSQVGRHPNGVAPPQIMALNPNGVMVLPPSPPRSCSPNPGIVTARTGRASKRRQRGRRAAPAALMRLQRQPCAPPLPSSPPLPPLPPRPRPP